MLRRTKAEDPQAKPTVRDIGFRHAHAAPSSTIALVNATIVTMRETNGEAEVIDGGTILIDRNRIEALGPDDSVQVPAHAKVIPMNRRYVLARVYRRSRTWFSSE